MDMDTPGGFLEHLYVSHAQYLKENGNEPFSHGNLTATLMDYFLAGLVIYFSIPFIYTSSFNEYGRLFVCLKNVGLFNCLPPMAIMCAYSYE